jgi:hypothetical protein
MTDRDKSNRQIEPDDESASPRGKDVMRGRSFAGANIANTERDQTSERQRIAEHGGENLDESGEVTDAEIEAREERRAERNED